MAAWDPGHPPNSRGRIPAPRTVSHYFQWPLSESNTSQKAPEKQHVEPAGGANSGAPAVSFSSPINDILKAVVALPADQRQAFIDALNKAKK